jgi:predicted transcriptional regulator
MPREPDEGLTLREGQIMEATWHLGEATVEEVRVRLAEELADSTIRTLLGVMEKKGYVGSRKGERGKAKVYGPLVQQKEAQGSALRQLTQRLFAGSADLLVARLVEDRQLSLTELDRLRRKLEAQEGEDRP